MSSKSVVLLKSYLAVAVGIHCGILGADMCEGSLFMAEAHAAAAPLWSPMPQGLQRRSPPRQVTNHQNSGT